MLSKKTFESEVGNTFKKWAKDFRTEFFRERPFTSVYGNTSFVRDQIEFVHLYLGHMQLDGTTRENLERIKQFLSLQRALEEGKDMRLYFIGGSPVEVFVTVENLGDIDIADVYGITEFEIMNVFKGKYKRWTPKSAKSFIDAVKNDLAFDGMESDLDYTFRRNYLNVECSIY